MFIGCSLFFSSFFKGLLFGSIISLFVLAFNYNLVETRHNHYGWDHYLEQAFEALYEVGMDNITRPWVTVAQESYLVYAVSFAGFAEGHGDKSL